jgi:hypothetical protein
LLIILISVTAAAAYPVWFLTRDDLPQNLKSFVNSRYSELVSHGSFSLLPFILGMLSFILSLIGLYFYWRPARVLYCGSLLIGIVQAVCLGTRVTTGWLAALDEVLAILCGVLLYMAFFSPVREKFECGPTTVSGSE